ncbi:MAG: hypothetical protein PHV74_15770 [Dehalococcoidia bacterium]|nr:hypothetical protein [Dehalococcoidia bacterium]
MSEKAIRELTTEFVEMYNSGDAVAAAELYTEDAKLLLPDMAIVSGRQAVQNFWMMDVDR